MSGSSASSILDPSRRPQPCRHPTQGSHPTCEYRGDRRLNAVGGAVSNPNALTRMSTLRVEVPVMWAVMITPRNTLSTLRRDSSSVGESDPTRRFRIRSSTSPAGEANVRRRPRLRYLDLVLLRSCRPGSISLARSASVGCWEACSNILRKRSFAASSPRRSRRPAWIET